MGLELYMECSYQRKTQNIENECFPVYPNCPYFKGGRSFHYAKRLVNITVASILYND